MNTITNNTQLLEHALAGLYDVIDPEIGLNVVDLGLIYQIDFDENEGALFCSMTLTTQFCPMGESIQGAVQNSLKASFPNFGVQVNVTFDPPWNVSLISPAGQEFLNQ